MIEHLHQYHLGTLIHRPYPLEEVFGYNVRFQILTDTQEQKDYLTAMQLMFGREVDIRTWETWNRQKGLRALQCHYDRSAQPLQLLPIYFSTSVKPS